MPEVERFSSEMIERNAGTIVERATARFDEVLAGLETPMQREQMKANRGAVIVGLAFEQCAPNDRFAQSEMARVLASKGLLKTD